MPKRGDKLQWRIQYRYDHPVNDPTGDPITGSKPFYRSGDAEAFGADLARRGCAATLVHVDPQTGERMTVATYAPAPPVPGIDENAVREAYDPLRRADCCPSCAERLTVGEYDDDEKIGCDSCGWSGYGDELTRGAAVKVDPVRARQDEAIQRITAFLGQWSKTANAHPEDIYILQTLDREKDELVSLPLRVSDLTMLVNAALDAR